jgi:gliding motility-associated-like protein
MTMNGSGLVKNSKDQNNLSSGIYQLSLTDANRCVYSWQIPVVQPDSLHITTKVEDIQCSGAGDGRIEAIVTGGAPAYSYLWTNGQTTPIISNLTIDDYHLTVTDQNSCTRSITAHVLAPDPLEIKVNKKDISCKGKMDGFISLEVKGGRSPFHYEWNSGETTSVLSGLAPASYKVRVKDWGGCIGAATVDIHEPDSLKVAYKKQDLLCHDMPSGKIELIPSGGTPPYFYMWSQGFSGSEAEDLKAGIYMAVIRDANNCPYNIAVQVSQPGAITLVKNVTQPYCPDTDDGSIKVFAKGGTGMLNYSWSNGDISSNLENLSEGRYILTVMDENNCMIKDTTMLETEQSGCLDIPSAISPNGDGVNDTWDIRAGSPNAPYHTVRDLYPNAIIQVFNRWGVLIYKSGPGYPKDWDGFWNEKMLPIDSYFYIFDLRNGKKPLTGTVTIIR